ncbi:MAG: hypothetical protein G3M78_09915 [Candidatus Nitrohelix vancouverensis]|uniref:Uncharacterized protein n=1 Tax=Candidatus Nitrohelix vancouverensis TaxID=2705534 RepID=A0A7T0C351_9BACT|nr:MAG: hypothetical protein G3M78_09915 [Candidatus Nitrohelix vancouverensis]
MKPDWPGRIKWIVFACFLLLAALVHRPLLNSIGNFLVVHEAADSSVDVIFTFALSEQVAKRAQSEEIKTIYVLASDYSRSWKALREVNTEQWIKSETQSHGIDSERVRVLTAGFESGPGFGEFLEQVRKDSPFSKAIIFIPYYQGRGYRFYLDHALGDGAKNYFFQPLESDYQKNFESWWLNTAYDNLFLDQYLRLGWYYFNYLLWDPVGRGAS